MKRSAENILASYIDALHPIIYINHFDFKVIDAAIAHVGQGAKMCGVLTMRLDLWTLRPKAL